jgi:hypothetical protein
VFPAGAATGTAGASALFAALFAAVELVEVEFDPLAHGDAHAPTDSASTTASGAVRSTRRVFGCMVHPLQGAVKVSPGAPAAGDTFTGPPCDHLAAGGAGGESGPEGPRGNLVPMSRGAQPCR